MMAVLKVTKIRYPLYSSRPNSFQISNGLVCWLLTAANTYYQVRLEVFWLRITCAETKILAILLASPHWLRRYARVQPHPFALLPLGVVWATEKDASRLKARRKTRRANFIFYCQNHTYAARKTHGHNGSAEWKRSQVNYSNSRYLKRF